MFKLLIVLAASIEMANAQFGNYIGYDWSAGKRGATLAEVASGHAVNRLDEYAKQHDIDYRITNAQSVFSSSSAAADQNLFNRMAGNTYQAVPRHYVGEY